MGFFIMVSVAIWAVVAASPAAPPAVVAAPRGLLGRTDDSTVDRSV